MISRKLVPFGATISSEMTRPAQAHHAINLSPGFPDAAEGRSSVRFAFCKKIETLRAAGERLRSLKP